MSAETGRSPRSRRAGTRRQRGATESLLAAALGLEAVLMIFVTFTVFGLKALPAAAAFGGGGALLVLFVVAAGLVRFRAGVAFGWVLQVALIATGVLVPIMFAIGAGFAGFWTWCFVKGRSLDRAKLEAAATASADAGADPPAQTTTTPEDPA